MKDKLKKISDYEWEIPKSGNMLVPAKFFSSELLLKDVEETAVEQLTNVAQLPGIQKQALAIEPKNFSSKFCSPKKKYFEKLIFGIERGE